MIEDNHRAHPIDKDGVVIYLWGDEQEGSSGFIRECRQEMIRQFVREKGVKLGLHHGDSFDWLRPTMRARLEGQLCHDASARQQISNMVRKAQDTALKDLTPFEGRMLGCHEGHHSWRYEDGTSTDQRLATALRTRYLGWIAATRLAFHIGKPVQGHYQTRTLTWLSTHGGGNGTAIGSDAKAISNMAMGTWADVYSRGHSCKSLVTPGLERGMIKRAGPPGVAKSVPFFVNVPGMCKSYTNGWESSYAERAGYIPQAVGWVRVRIGLTQSIAGAIAMGIVPNRGRRNPLTGKKQGQSYALTIQPTPIVYTDWGGD